MKRYAARFVAMVGLCFYLSAFAQESQSKKWLMPNAWDYTTTAVAFFSASAVSFLAPPPPARWTGPILFDEGVRSAFRLGSPEARLGAHWFSFITMWTGILAPAAIDAGLYQGYVNRDAAQVWTNIFMTMQILSYSTLVNEVTKSTVGRQRPYIAQCLANGGGESCNNADGNRSFYSGHTSAVFSAAGLFCYNHLKMGFAQSRSKDIAWCLGSVSLATFTGLLRIASDYHYASDVLTAAGLGFLIGFFTPPLLYSKVSSEEKGVALRLMPANLGPEVANNGIPPWKLEAQIRF